MSDIKDLIDKACGYNPSADRPQVNMVCPECKKEKDIFFDSHTMPAGTVTIENKCPECIGSDFSTEAYFDEHGKELIFE
jgi:predicted Zn-ribbon and HTH transcriptional regulator